MKKTLLMYWPTGGNVEKSAKRIADKMSDFNLDVCDFEQVDPAKINDYDFFVIGGSTAGYETWQDATQSNKWAVLVSKLREQKTNLNQKPFAVFGLGDQVMYPNNFVDHMVNIKNAFEEFNGKICGLWSTEGYDFHDSKALIDDKFCGLALDDDTQEELSEERVEKWIAQIKNEL